jgi:hypothetical protein
MALISFPDLPDSARLWIFNAERPLNREENDRLRAALESFLGQWAAHGSELTVGYQILHDRFLMVGVDDRMVGPSGCSIDAMTRFLVQAGSQLGVDFLDAPEVCYRDGDTINCVPRAEFARLAESGAVDSMTPVFDLTVSTVSGYRNGAWEKPAGESWHARAFDLRELRMDN